MTTYLSSLGSQLSCPDCWTGDESCPLKKCELNQTACITIDYELDKQGELFPAWKKSCGIKQDCGQSGPTVCTQIEQTNTMVINKMVSVKNCRVRCSAAVHYRDFRVFILVIGIAHGLRAAVL